jgi:hypothetical protein
MKQWKGMGITIMAIIVISTLKFTGCGSKEYTEREFRNDLFEQQEILAAFEMYDGSFDDMLKNHYISTSKSKVRIVKDAKKVLKGRWDEAYKAAVDSATLFYKKNDPEKSQELIEKSIQSSKKDLIKTRYEILTLEETLGYLASSVKKKEEKK